MELTENETLVLRLLENHNNVPLSPGIIYEYMVDSGMTEHSANILLWGMYSKGLISFTKDWQVTK